MPITQPTTARMPRAAGMVRMGVSQQDGFRLKYLGLPQPVCTTIDQDTIFD